MRLSGAVLTAFVVMVVSASAWAQGVGKKSVYFVDGMTCGACLGTISKSVAKVAGGAQVTGDPSEGVVRVMHEAGISAETIALAITESGYPARVMGSVDARPGEMEAMTASSNGITGGSCCAKSDRPACGGSTESWKALYDAMKERLLSEPKAAQNK
ncbi:heavy metal transporter [Desulfoluna limicola]|uniref:Heavy metal transporter n=1 Tax=Desulfoluna limicola TaxID=2810562 RepID=A0ABM7PP57_9BACT|nr:heavy metal-associated domain-containing protein [Desulfoluna limicola]BCS98872.1 heavy metal transporter [Desulfoluna limicola]